MLAKLLAYVALAEIATCFILTLALTSHTAAAQAHGATPLIGGGDKTGPVVSITPSNDTTLEGTVSVTIDWCDNVSLNAGGRSIKLNGVSVTNAFTYVTSSQVGCGAHATSTGTVTLRAGADTLVASIADNALNGGQATAHYSFLHFLNVSTSANNDDNQDYSICAEMCFAASYKANTVPYRTMDMDRDVPLEYEGDRLAVRPLIYADVSIATGGFTLQKYELQAKVNFGGGYVSATFTNSESALYFTPASQSSSVRLTGQLDASSDGTNVYPLQIIVTAIYTNGQHETVVDSSSNLMVVNERHSALARGWAFIGIPHLYNTVHSPGAMIVEGDGTARYYKLDRCVAGTCFYKTPSGDYSTLTRDTASNQYTRTFPDGIQQFFNTTGVITSMVDRFDNTTSYVYDSTDRLTEITDPYRTYRNGTTCPSGCPTYISIGYGPHGISGIAEPNASGQPGLGRNTRISVSSDSTLQSIADPDGYSTVFGYDASQRLTSVVSRRGDTTRLVYANDSSWKLAEIIKPKVPIDDGNGGTTLQSPTVMLSAWQTAGVPLGTTATSPATPVATTSVVGTVKDAGGHMTTYYVDRWGQPLKLVEPYGRTTMISRNGILAVKVTHPNGGVDTTAYNSNGLITYSQKAGEAYPTSYAYGSFARATAVSTAHSGIGTIFTYTSHGGDSLEFVAGQETKYFIDGRGRDTLIVGSLGQRTRLAYDSTFGNHDTTLFQTSIMDGWSPQGSKVFDSDGRDSIVRSATATTDTITYDSINRPLKVVTAHWKKTYVYDPLYRTHVKDSQGHDFEDTTNALGWVLSHTALSGAPIAFRYNLDGLLTSLTDGRGQIVSLQYDSLHRATKRYGPTIPADSFAYDVAGLRQVGSNANSTDSTFRSSSGWTDSIVTRIHGLRFRRYYKPTVRLQLDSMAVLGPSSISFLARKIFWDTTTHQIDSLRVNQHTTTLTYNAAGTLSEVRYPTIPFAVTTALTYAGPSNLEEHRYNFFRQFSRAYGYDFGFRLTEEDRDNAPGQPPVIRSFAYDSAGELTTVDIDTVRGLACSTEDSTYGRECAHSAAISALSRYTYDSVGNLSSEFDSSSAGGSTLTGSYLDDRATLLGVASYTYDGDGDRISRVVGEDTTRYGWNGDGQLDTVTRGSMTVGYAYNAFGQLVAKSINGSVNRYFLWDGNHLLAELDSSGTHRIGEYVYETPTSTTPFAMVAGADTGNVRYFAVDGLGNVIGSFHRSDSIVSAYDYDSYGVPVTAPSDSNRLRWKGLLSDGDSVPLYLAQTRWYDPAARRFLSPDPSGVSGGLHPYLYSGNSPVLGTDPTGLFAPSACYYDWLSCSASDADDLNWFDGEPLDDAYVCSISVLGVGGCLEEASEILLGILAPGVGWQQVTLDPVTPNGVTVGCGVGLGGKVPGTGLGGQVSIGLWQSADGEFGFYVTHGVAGEDDGGAGGGVEVGPEFTISTQPDDNSNDSGVCIGFGIIVCFGSNDADTSHSISISRGFGIYSFVSSTTYYHLGTAGKNAAGILPLGGALCLGVIGTS